MEQHMELTDALRSALDRHEFFLEYQPLYDLKTHRVIGLEALLRWHHPTLGALLPDVFVPAIENTDLLLAISDWMLQTACTQVKKWQRHFPQLTLALTVFEAAYKQENFIANLKQILADTQFAPTHLELEITEKVMLQNQEILIIKMHALKELGIHLTMDNFSLNMKNLPFDSLKMDKHFLDESATHNIDALISMINKMGISVLANGIENKEQVESLRKNHAEHLRGYYFSAPLNQEACTAFLEELREKA